MHSLLLRLSLPSERASERTGAGSCCLDEQKAQSRAFWMNRERGVTGADWMNREELNRGSEAVWMNSLENSKEGSLHG